MIQEKLDPINIGQTLKTFIKDTYKTQANFAEVANVDLRTVSRWISQGIDSIETLNYLISLFGQEFFEAL